MGSSTENRLEAVSQSAGSFPRARRIVGWIGRGGRRRYDGRGTGHGYRRLDSPAGAFCGVVGLMPTYGRVSRYGLIAFASSLDHIGPLTKTVKDAAVLLRTIAGRDPMDSTSAKFRFRTTRELGKPVNGLKIGVAKEYLGEGSGSRSRDAVEAAFQKLAEQDARSWTYRCRIPDTRSRPTTSWPRRKHRRIWRALTACVLDIARKMRAAFGNVPAQPR